MRNFTSRGDTITLIAPSDTTVGYGTSVGFIFGVAKFSALSGNPVEVETRGVFDLPKVASQQWASVGLRIYYDSTTRLATTTSTNNLFVGCNLATAANPSATGSVRLNGCPPGLTV